MIHTTTLDYFAEFPIEMASRLVKRRNVPMRVGEIGVPNEMQGNHFAWRLARRLEEREDSNDSEGIWPINGWRCSKRFGWPMSYEYTRELPLADYDDKLYLDARKSRPFCYRRVLDAKEAQLVLNAGLRFRYSCEITSDWYNPPKGRIVCPPQYKDFLGSHAIPIEQNDTSEKDRFRFTNSWGVQWGDHGRGSLSESAFDRFMIDAWAWPLELLTFPLTSKSGIVGVAWKWTECGCGVHGREVIDAATGDYLAWAFCVRRGSNLDLEEFFVWPSERGKGYGRFLADSVRTLASETELDLRVLVSYADTEADNLPRLQAAATMLGVALSESDIRGAHLVGTNGAATLPALTKRRPARPAFILERLRPSDEKPIDSPTQFVVLFGTNRKRTGDTDNPTFSNERDTCLHTGKVTVTIPTTHRFGCKGGYWHRLWAKICGDTPTLCKSTLYQTESEFAADILAMKAPQYSKPHNLLYIHGFSVNFEDACVQAARFGVDLKIPGTTFLYSWPSCGRFGLNNYMADETTSGASLPHFENFVEMIMAHTPGVPLSIIVHSMGNRIVTRFFEALAAQKKYDGRFKHVIFAAPDVDSDEFSHSATKFASMAHFTLYATKGDYALQASEWCHKNSRAGLTPPVITAPGIDTILVEGFNLLNLGHSYYAEASALLHDLYCLIHMSLSPDERPAIRRTETKLGKAYWKLAI